MRLRGHTRGTVSADRIVALPLVRGPRIPGVPATGVFGLIPVDPYGRVAGLPGVYAAGDATDYPIKQGAVACDQADAIATTIAAHHGAPSTPAPFEPILGATLLTGAGAPRSARRRDRALRPHETPRPLPGAVPDVPRRRSVPRRGVSTAAVDLYWIPLGAGGHCVRANGKVFEALQAARERRQRDDLYHAVLVVELGTEDYAIELAPSPDADEASRGVVATGAVGSRHLGRLRPFRYEVRRWRGGTIPDLGEAVGGPRRLRTDLDRPPAARRRRAVPTPVWGRDELQAGEMWNSNSMVAWLIAAAGLTADDLRPPPAAALPAGAQVSRWRGAPPRAAAERWSKRVDRLVRRFGERPALPRRTCRGAIDRNAEHRVPSAPQLRAGSVHAVFAYAWPAGDQARVIGVGRGAGAKGAEQVFESSVVEFGVGWSHLRIDDLDRCSTAAVAASRAAASGSPVCATGAPRGPVDCARRRCPG